MAAKRWFESMYSAINMKYLHRKLWLCLLIIIFAFSGCDSKKKDEFVSNTSEPNISLTVTDEWGKSAIDYNYIPCKQIKLGVIDTGTNFTEGILSISVCDQNNLTQDLVGHGTFIAAHLRSLLPDATIFSINVADENGEITVETLVEGIDRAIDLGCNIINISLGVEYDNISLRNKIERAIDMGIIIVSAAGNGYHDVLDYPAQYDGVISVIGRNPDNIDDISNNQSLEKKSFSAPNFVVFNESYVFSGSSVATTFVSALVAYLIQNNPTATKEKIISVLESSSIFPTDYSYGMINFERALLELQSRI